MRQAENEMQRDNVRTHHGFMNVAKEAVSATWEALKKSLFSVGFKMNLFEK